MKSEFAYRSAPVLSIAVFIQVAALVAEVVLPFGFDRPSYLGLDYSHRLILFGIYVTAAILGTVAGIISARWRLVAGQFCVLLGITVLLFLFFNGYLIGVP